RFRLFCKQRSKLEIPGSSSRERVHYRLGLDPRVGPLIARRCVFLPRKFTIPVLSYAKAKPPRPTHTLRSVHASCVRRATRQFLDPRTRAYFDWSNDRRKVKRNGLTLETKLKLSSYPLE
ncbi:jg19006, partial [Pararge aegeria aegeria]